MDLLHLEQQRQALEANLQQLRQSLKHWQIWEAEYEGLKEEIQGIDGELTSDPLESIARTYSGELVNEKEIRDLSGLDKNSPRTAKQIIGLIERRQEYVQKNIETVQRQFFNAEAKSEELAFAVASQNSDDDAGLPLTEIHEELDEDGNVISSRLSQPEEATAKVVESLRKVGLSDEDLEKLPAGKPKGEDLKPAITNASPPISPNAVAFDTRGHSDAALLSDGADDLERPSIRKKSVSFTADTKAAPEKPRAESEDGKKTVSFNDKVAVMPAAPPPDNRVVSFSPKVVEIPPQPLEPASPDARPLEKLDTHRESKSALKAEDDPSQSNVDKEIEAGNIVVPEDESPDDAQTRREMLEYHLNEVGHVVAQIDLEEAGMDLDDYDDDDNSSYHSTSEYLEDDDTPYTTGLSDSEESEDEFGRTKRRVVSPEYRKQMEELQQKLIGNLGPMPTHEAVQDADPGLDPKDVRRLVVREKRSSTSSASSESSDKKSVGKKRVSFAESLDVAEPPSPPLKAQKRQEGENVAPITTDVMERATATSHSLPKAMANENTSRFTKARAAAIMSLEDGSTAATAGSAIDDDDDDINDGNDTPLGPPGQTLATTLIERKPGSKPAKAPSTSADDPKTQRRQLAAEYYRGRNNLIRQQGGFQVNADQDDEDEAGELMEERDGKLKKVSRFKAARLKS